MKKILLLLFILPFFAKAQVPTLSLDTTYKARANQTGVLLVTDAAYFSKLANADSTLFAQFDSFGKLTMRGITIPVQTVPNLQQVTDAGFVTYNNIQLTSPPPTFTGQVRPPPPLTTINQFGINSYSFGQGGVSTNSLYNYNGITWNSPTNNQFSMFPTTSSSGTLYMPVIKSSVATLPVSVNGVYANDSGNISISIPIQSTPSLQQVTDVNNNTTNSLITNGNFKSVGINLDALNSIFLKTQQVRSGRKLFLEFNNNSTISKLYGAGTNASYFLPNKPVNTNYTLATLDDIATATSAATKVSSYGKNATLDSTVLTLSDGTRYAAKDSSGGGGGATGWSLTGNAATAGTDFIGTTNNTSFRTRTNNVERMIIDSLGNVGIGTTSANPPDQKLTVNGSIHGKGHYVMDGYSGQVFFLEGFGSAASLSSSGGDAVLSSGSNLARVYVNASTASTEITGFHSSIKASGRKNMFNVVVDDFSANNDNNLFTTNFSNDPGVNTFNGISIKATGATPSNTSYRGLYIDPTVTTANGFANIKAIETTTGSVNFNTTSGNTNIGTSTDVASSKLTVESTTKGFLTPRMTTAQRDAIATPADGLQVFNLTTGKPNYYYAGAWVEMGGGGGMAIGGAVTSATAGSVFFAGTGGTLQQKNTQFFWDSTNNRLGIGTTAPSQGLEVNGAIYASAPSGVSYFVGNGAAIRGNATSNGGFYLDASRNLTGTIFIRATDFDLSGITNPITISAITLTNATQALKIPSGAAIRGAATSNGVLYIDASQNLTGEVTFRGSNVNIGSSPTTVASALLNVESTTKGVLLPRMTTAQRDAITTPAEGLEIYNLTSHAKEFFNGTVWKTIITN